MAQGLKVAAAPNRFCDGLPVGHRRFPIGHIQVVPLFHRLGQHIQLHLPGHGHMELMQSLVPPDRQGRLLVLQLPENLQQAGGGHVGPDLHQQGRRGRRFPMEQRLPCLVSGPQIGKTRHRHQFPSLCFGNLFPFAAHLAAQLVDLFAVHRLPGP